VIPLAPPLAATPKQPTVQSAAPKPVYTQLGLRSWRSVKRPAERSRQGWKRRPWAPGDAGIGDPSGAALFLKDHKL